MYHLPILFAIHVDGLSGFATSIGEVPEGYITMIDSVVYQAHVRAGKDDIHDQTDEPEVYFREAGLTSVPSYRRLLLQEIFDTSHVGQAFLAKDAAEGLAKKYPAGIPHRIMKHLMNRLDDVVKYAASEAEVAKAQYAEEEEKDVVAKILAILLRTTTMDRILDDEGEPFNA